MSHRLFTIVAIAIASLAESRADMSFEWAQEINSVRFGYSVRVTGGFDFFGSRILNNDVDGDLEETAFLSPAFYSAYTDGTFSTLRNDWTAGLSTPALASASGVLSGVSPTLFYFAMDMTGQASDHFDQEFAFFRGNTLVASFRFNWRNGGSTSFTGSNWAPDRSDFLVVPAPGAFGLGLLGLTALIAGRRRISA